MSRAVLDSEVTFKGFFACMISDLECSGDGSGSGCSAVCGDSGNASRASVSDDAGDGEK